MRPAGAFASGVPIFRRKLLISFKFFLPNLSSICKDEALARAGEGLVGSSAQSYPQILCVLSYAAAARSCANPLCEHL
jgi:hypothetical protein